jgi:predicted GIY-YIG superfamily endonuclease
MRDSVQSTTVIASFGLNITGERIARETQLKKWNSAKKITLIERMNPTWADLSRDWFECEPADYRRATDRLLS